MFSKNSMFKRVSIVLSVISIFFLIFLPIFQNKDLSNEGKPSSDEVLVDLIILEAPSLTDFTEITYNYEILRGGENSVDLIGTAWEFFRVDSVPGSDYENYVKIDSGESSIVTPGREKLVFSNLMQNSKYELKFEAWYANEIIKTSTLSTKTQSILKAKVNSYRLQDDFETESYDLIVNYDVSNFYQDANGLASLTKLFLYKASPDDGRWELNREMEVPPNLNEEIIVENLSAGVYFFVIKTRIPESFFGVEKLDFSRSIMFNIPERNIFFKVSNFEFLRDETRFDIQIKSPGVPIGELINYEYISATRIIVTKWTPGEPRPPDKILNFKLEPGDDDDFDRGLKRRVAVPNIENAHMAEILFQVVTSDIDGDLIIDDLVSQLNFVEYVWNVVGYTRTNHMFGFPVDILTLKNDSSYVSKYDFKNLVITITDDVELPENPVIGIELGAGYFNSNDSYNVVVPSGHELIEAGENYIISIYVNADTSKPLPQWKDAVSKFRFTV